MDKIKISTPFRLTSRRPVLWPVTKPVISRETVLPWRAAQATMRPIRVATVEKINGLVGDDEPVYARRIAA